MSKHAGAAHLDGLTGVLEISMHRTAADEVLTERLWRGGESASDTVPCRKEGQDKSTDFGDVLLSLKVEHYLDTEDDNVNWGRTSGTSSPFNAILFRG